MEASSLSVININLEIKWFLTALKSHSKRKLQLNGNALNELAAIVSHIGTLIRDASIVLADNGAATDDLQFYQGIYSSDDWKNFQVDNVVTCRICHMHIGLSHGEIEAHIKSEKHRWNADRQKSSFRPSSAELHFSSATIEGKHDRERISDASIHADDEISDASTDSAIYAFSNNTNQEERTLLAADGSSDEAESSHITVVTQKVINASTISAILNSTEINDHLNAANRKTPMKVASQTSNAIDNDASSGRLLRMSAQLSAYLESHLPTGEPVNAGIKKIFAQNIDYIVKQELESSAAKIMFARRDLSVAVNVGVALKRKVYLYGSFAYGAPCDKGIINIFFDYDKIHHTSKAVPKQCAVAQETLMAHLNESNLWAGVKPVKVMDQRNALEAMRKSSGTFCHFTFDSGVPVATATLIEHFFKLQPMCHKVVVFVRYWQMMLNRENNNCLPLSGYLLTVLVVFFFQFIGLLPSVYALQNKEGLAKVTYNAFHVHFDVTSKPTPATASCQTYLHRFFSFYGDMLKTAEHFFISPYHGKIICRRDETAQLTAEQTAEKASLKMMRGAEWTNKSLYVQDLFMRSNNIGNAVTAEEITSFQKCCAQSSAVLSQK